MAAELTLLVNFAVILIAAELGSLAFAALRLPRVIGMLAAGILIGPGVNPFAGALNLDATNVRDLAFLGSIFLMFSIGLTYNLRSFRDVTRGALLTSVVAAFASFALGFAIARGVGLSLDTSLFVGLLLAPTSSTISLRLAGEMNLLATRGIDTTIAAIVFDDVIALVIATVVISITNPAPGAGALQIGLGLILIVLLTLAIILVGVKTLPRALDIFARLGRGNPALVIISFALFVAFLFTRLDLPPILGAFWAGTMTAASRYGPEMRSFLQPVTELFSAVFFAAIGLLFAPSLLRVVGPVALLLIAAGVLAKLLGGFATLRLAKIPVYPALMCSTLLIPRGEISLVIAQYSTNHVDQQVLLALGILITLATALITPLAATAIRAGFQARQGAARPPSS